MQNTVEGVQARFDAEQVSLFTVLLFVESMHFIFARLLLPSIAPLASAMYVLAVATVEVGVYVVIRRRLRRAPAREHLWFFLSIGFLIAASTVLSYTSVEFIDPGTASMLSKTGVIISLLLSVFWLRERLTRQQLAGAGLAVAGAIVISYHPGNVMQLGSLFVLASTLLYALHTAIVKRWGGGIEFLNFFFYRLLATTAFLLLFAGVGQELVWPDAATWGLLIVVGTVDVVISRALYYLTLRTFPMSIHTIILTLSPVVSIALSYFLFRTFPGVQELIGGVAVLAGVVIVTRRW